MTVDLTSEGQMNYNDKSKRERAGKRGLLWN